MATETIIIKRDVVINKINRLHAFADTANDSADDLIKFKLRYKELDKLAEQFEQLTLEYTLALHKVKNKTEEINNEIEKQEDVRAVMENKVTDIQFVYNKLCTEVSDLSKNNQSSTNMSRDLPRLALPIFDGEKGAFLNYYDLFTHMVHNKDNISDVEKFQYLKLSLKNEPLNVIKHLPVTADNYQAAWKQLKDEYYQPRALRSLHINRLLEIPKIGSNTLAGMKTLLNTARENIAALQALNLKTDAWAPLLETIFSNKLDADTRQRWELTLNNEATPTHDQLLNFLKQQITSLESVTTENKLRFEKHSYQHPKQKSRVTLMTTSQRCELCKEAHNITKCQKFLDKLPPERYAIIKAKQLCVNCCGNHKLNACQSSERCRKCSKSHHSLLHFQQNQQQPTGSEMKNENTEVSTISPWTGSLTSKSTVLLATAQIQILDAKGNPQRIRALLDCGSQANYITDRCAKQLGLQRRDCKTTILALGEVPVDQAKGATTFSVTRCGETSPSISVSAIIIKSISDRMPTSFISRKRVTQANNLVLADPDFNKPGEVDVLLAADIFPKILLSGRVQGLPGSPTAIETIFGWILMGETSLNKIDDSVNCFKLSTTDGINQMLTKFWELDQVPSYGAPINLDDQRAEECYSKSVRRDDNGRYIVSLPFKEFPPQLGNSYQNALRCHTSLVRRLEKNSSLRQQYIDFLRDYEEQGHMKLLDPQPDPLEIDCYYIPHLCVVRPESETTALRVVFNASKPTTNGKSLNNFLHTGASLQRDIFALLLLIRLPLIVLTADVRQMYRQIMVTEEHRRYQRILWNFDTRSQPHVYELCTVTYGTNCGPFLAIRTVNQLAEDEKENFPAAAEVLRSQVYMDDVLCGADNIEEALSLRQELTSIFQKGGFSLRKWASNESEVLKEVPQEDRKFKDLDFNEDTTIKLLGVCWSPTSDELFFTINITVRKCTKRNILSEVAKIFDPSGFLSPIVMTMKKLIQHLWLRKLQWDELLPEELAQIWHQWLLQLEDIKSVRIPRHVPQCSSSLIGFADASEKGYCAVVYFRSTFKGQINVSLLCSKTRVTPLKKLTIARLELCASLLLAKLITAVTKNSPFTNSIMFAFTDSMVTLQWLSDAPHRWKTFVANRVAEIQELLPCQNWYHVSSESNAADPGSRGLMPSEFTNNKLWFNGPTWLKTPINTWPVTSLNELPAGQHKDTSAEETIFTFTTSKKFRFELFDRISTFTKLRRITAYCLRFVNRSKEPKQQKEHHDFLTSQELEAALSLLVRLAQEEVFGEEFKCLREKKQCHKQFQLLSPFIDERNIIRVGGRLRHSDLNYDAKFPILLPGNHTLTKLLIRHFHVKYLHVGQQTLSAIIARKFWIIAARKAIRKEIHQCHVCFRHNPKPTFPLMGDLPPDRIRYAKPFSKCGVDYGGPFNITISRGRGNKTQKAYLCLFVCFVTKAVHLELASDLSTEKFLLSFRRLISRRGRISDIHSDCGTNFVGAKRHLSELTTLLTSKEYNNKLANTLAEEGIQWHLNPPSAPHMGGLWEAGIKATKTLLLKVIGDQILSYEELSTVLTEVEAILNSRPLYEISSDPSDLNALTPGHFLVGEPQVCLPNEDLLDTATNKLNRWQLLTKIQQSFWKRWRDNYLNTLQQRKKWHTNSSTISEGNIIIVNDSPAPPLKWRLGRILKLVYGPDQIARVAEVRTASGVITRPLVKLCPLPGNNYNENVGHFGEGDVPDRV